MKKKKPLFTYDSEHFWILQFSGRADIDMETVFLFFEGAFEPKEKGRRFTQSSYVQHAVV